MEERNKHKGNQIESKGNQFLKEDFLKGSLAQEHKDYLGMDIPDNYFNQSKQDILNSLPMTNKEKRTVFGLKPIYAYPLAASVVLLLGIFLWMLQKNPDQVTPQTFEVADVDFAKMNDQDVLTTSLMVDDADINTFMDELILEKIVVEAELAEQNAEQQLNNLFINSLFVDDSQVEDYLEKGILENIVL